MNRIQRIQRWRLVRIRSRSGYRPFSVKRCRTRPTHSLSRGAIFAVGALCIASVYAGGGHTLTAELAEAEVTVTLPGTIGVGDTVPLEVFVKPMAGQPEPNAVRARFGMPDHGHWVTEEVGHPFTGQNALSFSGAFPMSGRYRFRIWLDYPDGHNAKTAVDFSVSSEKDLDPGIVE